MIWLLLTLYASPQLAACECLCLEGRPRTLCETVDEARTGVSLCPPHYVCPLPAAPEEETHLEAPLEHTHHCRRAHLSDPAGHASARVPVCDVEPA